MGKWMAKYYDTFMEPLERRGIRQMRRRLAEQAKGHVLEIGSGTGLNFPYYRQAVDVTAIEPDNFMRERSLAWIEKSLVPIEVVAAGAEKLPFPDQSFDTVVGTLVFCTIAKPLQALEEIRRVSKPGAKLLLYEHVRVEHSFLGFLQDWLTPIWKKLADGCHLNRNTLDLVHQAGFQIVSVESSSRDIFLMIEAVRE